MITTMKRTKSMKLEPEPAKRAGILLTSCTTRGPDRRCSITTLPEERAMEAQIDEHLNVMALAGLTDLKGQQSVPDGRSFVVNQSVLIQYRVRRVKKGQ